MPLRRPFSCSGQWPSLRCQHRTPAVLDKGHGKHGSTGRKNRFHQRNGGRNRAGRGPVFAAEGATVFGCDLDADAAAETVELVEKAGGVMRSLAPVDLSTEAGAREWIDAGIEALGGIDILYNNACALRNGPFATMPAEDWYFTIKNELDVPYFCTQAAWPHLIARGGGAVLDVASVAAVRGAPFMPMVPHGAAKGGVLAMNKHLCAAGAPHHIRVNTIAPGMTRTSATEPFLDDPDGPKAPYRVSIRRGAVMHLSALRAGMPFVILQLIPLLLAPVLSRMLTRVDARRLLMGGLLPMAAGQFWIAALPITTTSLAAFIGPVLLLGVGFICVVSSLTSAAVNAVPIHMTGMASGATSLVREFGQGLGPASSAPSR
ncbi:SDR family oxidoreductase [Streptomyces sp. NPDC059697]|uniref:SDR family oxidoreductase n=1 Tax=Streptomyces sp. NPDC059697 TaxID=3346912 RepID=UPI0036BD4443